MTDRPHGYARYKLDSCRCYTCGYANAEYYEARARGIAYGTWQPFTDAAPVRKHIANLQACGLGTRGIARLAGLDRKRVYVLIHGRAERGTPPPPRIRPATAAAILAVEPTLDNLPGSLRIDATGMRRRLEALIAMGWPKAQLADRLGMAPGNFGHTLNLRRVIVRTVRAVHALYAELWRADPREHAVDKQAYSRTINYGRAHRFAPPGTWDDDTIDDPAAFPDWTGQCGTPTGYNAHYRHDVLPACQPCREARAGARALRAVAS